MQKIIPTTMSYYFPDKVWELICVYCDDRIEQGQRILMRNIIVSRTPYYNKLFNGSIIITHIVYSISEKRCFRKPPFQRHTSSFLLTKYFYNDDSIIDLPHNLDQYTYLDSDSGY